jgi:hypothetical protein
MTRQYHKIALATAAVLGLASVVNTAHAGWTYGSYDRKSYTGAQCQPAYGIHSPDFTIYKGGLRNDNASYRWVSCAITFDAEDALDSTDSDGTTPAGYFELDVYLDYSGAAASYTTNCTLAGRTPFGTNLTQAGSVTSGATATAQSIYFSAAPLDGLAIGNQATIQVSCLLPPKVALGTIKVYEAGRTDENFYTP